MRLELTTAAFLPEVSNQSSISWNLHIIIYGGAAVRDARYADDPRANAARHAAFGQSVDWSVYRGV